MINHPASAANVNDTHPLHVDQQSQQQQQLSGRKRKSPCDDHLRDDRGHELDNAAVAASHEHVTSSPSHPLAYHSPSPAPRWNEEDEDEDDDDSAKSDTTSGSWSSVPSTFSSSSRSSSSSGSSAASTHSKRSKRPRTSPIDVDVTPSHSSFVLPATHHQQITQHHHLSSRDASPFPSVPPSVLSSPTMSHANGPSHAHSSTSKKRRSRDEQRRGHGLRRSASAGRYASQMIHSDSDSHSENSASSTPSSSASAPQSPLHRARAAFAPTQSGSSMSNPSSATGSMASHHRQRSPPLTLPNNGPARGCLNQSCFFRFASMMDGMHLANSMPGQSPIYIPSLLPPINRYTLQELDLAAILRNPQLRHDLLFDSGLQFRPTDSRRKREATDTYWRAVKSELEHGCACVSFDENKVMHRHECLCQSVQTPTQSSASSSARSHRRTPYELPPLPIQFPRIPSRIKPLISELREVILAVVLPPPLPPSFARGGVGACGCVVAGSGSGASTPSSSTSANGSSASGGGAGVQGKHAESARPNATRSHSHMKKAQVHSSQAQSQIQNSVETKNGNGNGHGVASGLRNGGGNVFVKPRKLSISTNFPAQSHQHPMLPSPSELSAITPSLSPISASVLVQTPAETSVVAQSFGLGWLYEAFDGALIEQQLRHGVFDLSRLFEAVGELLRRHCAPLRDAMVNAMVELAGKCKPGGGGGLDDALKAIKMCFEIVEIMRLDLANHHLSHLRPYLYATAPKFEWSVFGRRSFIDEASTREWLKAAMEKVDEAEINKMFTNKNEDATPRSCTNITDDNSVETDEDEGGETQGQPRRASQPQQRPLHQNPATHRFVTAIVGALIDLVVSPPTPPPATLPPSPTTTPITKIVQAQVQQRSTPPPPSPSAHIGTGFPETLHLDHSRLLVLGADAADINANFMLLTLFRQLTYEHEASGKGGKGRKDVSDEELERVRREIAAVGPARLGLCFCDGYELESGMEMDEPPHRLSHHEKSVQSWRSTMEAVIFQLATRIERRSTKSTPDASESPITAAAPPSRELLDRVKRWVTTHVKRGSPLCTLFRKKLREQLLREVVPLFYTLWSSGQVYAFDAGRQRSESGLTLGGSGEGSGAGFKTGLEPLSGEVRVLAERLAKLAVLHLRVYWAYYEQIGRA